jgi:hypothetical protein
VTVLYIDRKYEMNTVADVSASQESGHDVRLWKVSRDAQEGRLADLCFALLSEFMVEKTSLELFSAPFKLSNPSACHKYYLL